jgi:hypothetical protein
MDADWSAPRPPPPRAAGSAAREAAENDGPYAGVPWEVWRRMIGLLGGCGIGLTAALAAPGCCSGKSTTAAQLGGEVYSSDDFFERGGPHNFHPGLLPQAHAWNQQRVADALRRGAPLVVVDNTNTQAWEMLPYVNAVRSIMFAVVAGF